MADLGFVVGTWSAKPYAGGKGFIVRDGAGRCVTKINVSQSQPLDEKRDCAHLIAAAPDLYEALLAMATRHKDSPYIGMARAAIAKANPPTA